MSYPLNNKQRLYLFLLLCIITFILRAEADTIKIKDGGTIQGIIIEESADRVVVELKYGKTTLSRSNIESISKSTKETNDALKKNWETGKREAEEAAKRAQQKSTIKTTASQIKSTPAGTVKSTGIKPTATIPTKPLKPSYQHGRGYITTDNYANKTLQYYFYIPGTVLENKNQSYPLLLAIPWLSGKGEDLVTPEFKDFAYKNKFVIISPSFMWDEKNWDANKSYQFPEVWSGDALLKIINSFKQEHNIRISKYYMFGFSAGAQFALRFAFWKPDFCVACAAHGSGAHVNPERKVKTKFFITCGTQDFGRIDISKEFCDLARQRGIDVTYKTYNTDHSLTPAQIEDTMKFFGEIR